MRTTCKVVMLPTEKATGLFIQTMDYKGSICSKQELQFTTNKTLIRNNHLISNRRAATNVQDKYVFFELYILSNDEIKEGDWCIDNQNIVRQIKTKSDVNIANELKYPKVIASTDKSLLDKIAISDDPNNHDDLDTGTLYPYDKGKDDKFYKLLPQIPESFIKAYIKAYNEGKPITEVIVWYYTKHLGGEKFVDTVKVRPDNTIVIHQAKTYTFKEVEQLCFQAFVDHKCINGKIKPSEVDKLLEPYKIWKEKFLK